MYEAQLTQKPLSNKQLSVGHHSESAWPTWTRYELCVRKSFAHKQKILLVWICTENNWFPL